MFKQFIKQTPFGISMIVLALAVGVLVLVAPISGNKSLIVRSGSMTPTIGVGDLVLVTPKQNYAVGDVISFKDPIRSETTITHRIAAIKTQNGITFFQTKGDANKSPDSSLVPQKNILGSVNYAVHDIGKLFALVKTKNGFLAATILPASFVIILELVTIFKELKKPKLKSVPKVASQPAPPALDPSGRKIIYLKKARFRYFGYGKPMGLNNVSSSLVNMFYLLWEKLKINGGRLGDSLPYYSAAFKMFLPITVSALLVTSTLATFYTDSEVSPGNKLKAAASFASPTPTPQATSSAALDQ